MLSENSVQKSRWSKLAFTGCCIACFGDLAITFIFPSFYPGYQPDLQAISVLGIAASPVGHIVSFLWILLGLVFLVFAFSYYKSNNKGSAERKAAWLIAIYALCDVVGSGAFPGTFTPGKMTTAQNMHNVLGALGTLAILVTPFILMKKGTTRESHFFFRYLVITSVSGLTMWFLFIIGRSGLNVPKWILNLHGIWQRIFLVTYYLFLVVLSYRNVLLNSLNATIPPRLSRDP